MDLMLEERKSVVEEVHDGVEEIPSEVDFQCEQKNKPTTQRRSQLKTRVAKVVYRVLGDGYSKQLEEFDKHHILFKNEKYESSRKICQKILPTLQNKVREKMMYYEEAVNAWEKDFFSKN